MENFTVGEVVWAKVRGYPWWPAMITGTEDDNKEKKYVVNFIGDNTHANLPKKELSKFMKEYKRFASTKKKSLHDAIVKAKEIYESKKISSTYIEEVSKKKDPKWNPDKDQSNTLTSNKQKTKNAIPFDDTDIISIKNNNSTLNPGKPQIKQIPSNTNNSNSFWRKKIKRIDEKNGIELVYKIINYLGYITKMIIDNNMDKVKDETACLLKVMEFLKDYKISEPIGFLKKTNWGKFVNYIKKNIQEGEVKIICENVYNNFEEQVISQLFRKAK